MLYWETTTGRHVLDSRLNDGVVKSGSMGACFSVSTRIPPAWRVFILMDLDQYLHVLCNENVTIGTLTTGSALVLSTQPGLLHRGLNFSLNSGVEM